MFSPMSFLAHALVEAGALVEHGGAGEIVEEKADQIEHGGRLENHRPAAGLDLARMARGGGLLAGALRPAPRDRCWRRSGELALAQPEESRLQNGDGKFGARLAMRGEEAAGIGQGHCRGARGEDAGGGLRVFSAARAHTRATARARSCRRGGGGSGEIALDLARISAGRAWAAGRDFSAGCAPALRRRPPRGAAIRRRSCWWWRARCGRRRRCARRR